MKKNLGLVRCPKFQNILLRNMNKIRIGQTPITEVKHEVSHCGSAK